MKLEYLKKLSEILEITFKIGSKLPKTEKTYVQTNKQTNKQENNRETTNFVESFVKGTVFNSKQKIVKTIKKLLNNDDLK